jgi:hypothetical protein
LRADAGVTADAANAVSLWEDQSPNGFDATQATAESMPKLVTNAINSKPALRFDGGDDYLDVATAAGLDIVGDIASFAVIRVDDYANYNGIWGKTAGPNANLPAPNDYYLIQGTGVPQLYRGDAGTFQNVQGERPVRANNYAVIGFKQTGTSVTHYLNGATNGVGEITAVPGDAGTNLKIGTREDLFTKLKGDMAELLIYNGTLSDQEITTAIEYLRNKYGILNSAPIVSITAPANNASLAAPANVNVVVSAVDDDGTIERVDLLANGRVIASATAAPFTFPVSMDTPGTVTFSAIAYDDKDANTASSNRVVTITGTIPTFSTSPKLKLWLRADQGVTVDAENKVSAWADQSGNNNNAVQGDPAFAPTLGTLDGKPAVSFDAVEDYLDVADSDSISITNDIASFFVTRFADFAGFRAVWSKTSGNQARPLDYYLTSAQGVPTLIRGYSTNNEAGDPVNVNQSVAGAGRVAAGSTVFLGFQQQGADVTHYLNGAPFGTGRITLQPQDLDTPLKIGSRDDFGTFMKGEIAELLIFNAALTTEELATVRQYLGGKYNLPSVQVANTGPVTGLEFTGSTQITVPSDITVNATAADADGSVVRVDFYANGGLIGSDTTAPYSASAKVNRGGNVVLTAVAVDNLGLRKEATNSISLTATGGEPAAIPADGLVLWLRPDRGVTMNTNGLVTLWEDWSGNFNNARQTDETKAPRLVADGLNGHDVLQFDGTNDFLEVGHSSSLAIAGDISTFFVINVEDYGTFRAVWGKTAGNLPAANDYYLLPNDGLARFYHGTAGGAIGQVTSTAPVPSGEYVTAGYSLGGTTATHYLNGAENGTGELTAAGGDSGTPLLIGTRGDQFTRFKGAFAELVIYNRVLTEQEWTTLQSYFQQKYFGGGPNDVVLSVSRAAANAITISWLASAGGTLESSTAVGPTASWTAVTEPVVPNGDSSTVTVTATGTTRFFRLRR